MKRSYCEVSLSRITPIDRSVGELNGMPTSDDILDLVVLIEAAREKMTKLPPDSPQRLKIEQALAELYRIHNAADHFDADNQCGARPTIRKSKSMI